MSLASHYLSNVNGMKKIFLIISFVIFQAACGVGPQPVTLPSGAYDPQSDLALFLSATSVKVESEALQRLQSNQLSHETIKNLLRMPSNQKTLPGGLQTDLKIESNNRLHPYSLFVPESGPPEKTYPLIVILHGLGGSGETTLQSWLPRLKNEFMIACPSYPGGAWWSRPAEEMVLKLTRQIRSRYPVDTNRLFIAGLSNGAIGAYMIGMFYPDLFAGIVPIAGAITERYMRFLVNLNNTPIHLIQGRFDPMFPIKYSRRIHKILQDMRYPVIYREHEEKGRAHGGHFLPESEIPALYDWLMKQRRVKNPKVIRMTREANHLDRIYWARITKGFDLAALQIPGPEQEPLNIRQGKIATLFAVLKDQNEIDLMGENVLGIEIYLNSEMVNFEVPVRIHYQPIMEVDNKLVPGEKRLVFHQKVAKDSGVLLRTFKDRKDADSIYDAVVSLSLETETKVASIP